MAIHIGMSALSWAFADRFVVLACAWDRHMFVGGGTYLGRVEVDALYSFAPGTLRLLVVSFFWEGGSIGRGIVVGAS